MEESELVPYHIYYHNSTLTGGRIKRYYIGVVESFHFMLNELNGRFSIATRGVNTISTLKMEDNGETFTTQDLPLEAKKLIIENVTQWGESLGPK